MTRTPYENLHLLPSVVAQVVTENPYTGIEWSDQLRSPTDVARIEEKRQQMTTEQRTHFIEQCDKRCRDAYEARAEWFDKMMRSARCREKLYCFTSHWLSAYLNP